MYINSIVDPLKRYKVWDEVLNLSHHFKDFSFILTKIQEARNLHNLAKDYFSSDKAKALDFLNSVYKYAKVYCDQKKTYKNRAVILNLLEDFTTSEKLFVEKERIDEIYK